ncbi:hypothetical protein ABW21_db0204460 [Orbilia brochopaga]|nr:hypothetical protein ABW21_db0204460 [Drechslerella brochopaga]
MADFIGSVCFSTWFAYKTSHIIQAVYMYGSVCTPCRRNASAMPSMHVACYIAIGALPICYPVIRIRTGAHLPCGPCPGDGQGPFPSLAGQTFLSHRCYRPRHNRAR